MKILFVLPYPQGKAPSQRFRMEQYFVFLQRQGFEIEVSSFWSASAWSVLYLPGQYFQKAFYLFSSLVKRLWLLTKVSTFDFVFVHREAIPVGFPIWEFLVAKVWKKKIIYDFDDAIWIPHISNNNKLAHWLKYPEKVSKICRWANKVSVGNAYLADYVRLFQTRVQIMPTTIDTKHHVPAVFKSEIENEGLGTHKPDDKEPQILGWTGTHSTIKYLDSLIPILDQIQKVQAFKLRVISDQKPYWDRPYLDFVYWNKDNEIQDLQSIDIGLMPLEPDAWSRGKCGFKALQYMALGKPALVSPEGVNREIVTHGIHGYHCAKAEDWSLYICALLNNSDLRTQMGIAAREKIETTFSVNAHEDTFLSLFES